VALLADMLLNSTFPIRRSGAHRARSLVRRADAGERISRTRSQRTCSREGRVWRRPSGYGRACHCPERTVKAITRDDVSFAKSYFRHGLRVITVQRRHRPEDRARRCGANAVSIAGRRQASQRLRTARSGGRRTIYLVDKPGRPVRVSVRRAGPSRSTPDYYALR
jgi:hypothetical protein